MVARFYKLLLVFLIVGASLYLVVMNRDPVTFKLSDSWSISAYGGIVYIIIFAAGILCTALVTLIFGIKVWFREKQWQKRERLARAFLSTLSEARSAVISGDIGRATRLWQDIALNDPQNTMARIELSRCLEQCGDLQEALKVIDAARASDPSNIEVLFRAAELNIALGNRTAAMDSLSMACLKDGSAKAARMARDLSEELGRYNEALEYHDKLCRLEGKTDNEYKTRLTFKKQLKDGGIRGENLMQWLEKFISENREFSPAIARLAEEKNSAGQLEEAASLYARAAAVSENPAYWKIAVSLWIKNARPEKAIAAARSALKASFKFPDSRKISARLDLLDLYINLNMNQDAGALIAEMQKELDSGVLTFTPELRQRFLLLSALLEANTTGQTRAAETIREITGPMNCNKAEESDLSTSFNTFSNTDRRWN